MGNSRRLEPIPIDPLIDPVFKLLFGTEGNKDILLDFLNAVLDHIGESRAVSIEFVPPRNLRAHAEAKETEVDVRAKDARGRMFQIEVQLDPGGPLTERMIYGAGQLYASTIGKGESYSELKPALSIWLLRDRIPRSSDEPKRAISEYRFRSPRGRNLGAYPAIVVIELQNWTESANFEKGIERWLYFFVHGKELSLSADLPPQIRSEVFMKAVNETKRFNDSQAKRLAYLSRMDKIRWNNSLKAEAEAQRKQDEAQRKQDEALRSQDEDQRKQDEAQRKQDEAYRQETERLAATTRLLREEIERARAENEKQVQENERQVRENERQVRENEKQAREIEKRTREIEESARENEKRANEIDRKLLEAEKLIAALKAGNETPDNRKPDSRG